MSRKQVVHSSDHARALVITYKNGKKWHEKLKEGSSVVVWKDRKSGAHHVTYGIQVACKNEEGLEFKHHESTTTPPIAAIEVTEKWADGAKVTYKNNYALVRPAKCQKSTIKDLAGEDGSEEVFTISGGIAENSDDTDGFKWGVVYTCHQDYNQGRGLVHFRHGDKFKLERNRCGDPVLKLLSGTGYCSRWPIPNEPIKVKVLDEDQ